MSVILAMKTEYNNLNILQSVKSDEEILDKEWKDINWKSIEYDIFKIQNGYLKQRRKAIIEKLINYVDYQLMIKGVYYMQ